MENPWATLLDGPRGRQLAVLLAVGVERRRWPGISMDTVGPLADAVFYSEIDSPCVRYTDYGGVEELPVVTEEQHLFDALKGINIEDLNVEELPENLDEVVNSAKYWQEPNRIDERLNHPEPIRLLEPWVDRLTRLDATAWWASPVDLNHQFIVEGPGAGRWETPVAERLIEWRRETLLDEEQARRERPTDPQASWSGCWWSTPPTQGTTRAWPDGPRCGQPLAVSLLEDAYFAAEDAVWEAVSLPRSPRVLELVTAQDWVDLCREYPLDVSASRRHDWYRCTGRVGNWVIPDWSQIARTWDAVHLPLAAYLALVGRALDVGGGWASVIAGWSPDMTYWLTTDPPRISAESL